MSSQPVSNNIYISYAYVDNQNFEDDSRGWISAFKDDLENELSFLIGQISPITIFHDKQFESPNLLTIKYIRSTKIFIVIGTPAYFLSDFCQKELELFVKRNDENPFPHIFLVDKKPFEEATLHGKLPASNYFSFYGQDDTEWSRNKEKEKYLKRISELAEGIKISLNV